MKHKDQIETLTPEELEKVSGGHGHHKHHHKKVSSGDQHKNVG
jgi:hypothetical protein